MTPEIDADSDLAAVLKAWPALSETERQCIRLVVEGALAKRKGTR